eukprot:7385650-Prymnesium_polylepis.2
MGEPAPCWRPSNIQRTAHASTQRDATLTPQSFWERALAACNAARRRSAADRRGGGREPAWAAARRAGHRR